MNATARFELRSFDELELRLLHDLYRLRAEVFVVEQVCPYQDIDGLDPAARHLLGLEGDRLVACARILDEDGAVWIGRIAVAPDARGRGLGRAVLDQALTVLADDPRPRKMNAQAQLEDFYASFGFRREGRPFLEDGIPHILMTRSASDANPAQDDHPGV